MHGYREAARFPDGDPGGRSAGDQDAEDRIAFTPVDEVPREGDALLRARLGDRFIPELLDGNGLDVRPGRDVALMLEQERLVRAFGSLEDHTQGRDDVGGGIRALRYLRENTYRAAVGVEARVRALE